MHATTFLSLFAAEFSGEVTILVLLGLSVIMSVIIWPDSMQTNSTRVERIFTIKVYSLFFKSAVKFSDNAAHDFF
jgi:hypothetical protein